MGSQEREHGSLKAVGGAPDKKRAAARKYCTDLTAHYLRFGSGAEKAIEPGMLVQWKRGMKNRKTPEYDVPVIVMELLNPPIIDSTFESGSTYFRERLDIVLGFLDEDRDFCLLHYDSRRFEPCAETGVA